MERIKLAIEKAKEIKKNHAENDSKNNNEEKNHDHELVLDNITYNITRTVGLDKEHLEKNRILAFSKDDNVTMSFDLLRTQVLQKMESEGWKTIAITSPTPESGKTVLSINLAMSIAHDVGKSVVLVDFDLRRPKVARYLGVNEGPSLNDYFSGESSLSEAFVNPGLPRIVILPTINSINKSSELLASKKVSSLINELKNRYSERIVIFDLPPVLNTDDAITLLPKVDCVLLVIGNGMITSKDLKETMRLLNSTPILGVVLNKAELDPQRYYGDY